MDSSVIGDFYQVSIRIPDIDTPNAASSTGAIHDLAALENSNLGLFQSLKDVGHIDISEEAQIVTARLYLVCFGLELCAMLVEIDFLLAELQSMADNAGVLWGREAFCFHAENFCVELLGRVNVGHGEYQMIQGLDLCNGRV